MTSSPGLPPGIEALDCPAGTLFVAADHAQPIREAGLESPRGWEDRLARGSGSGPGRGSMARLRLTGGTELILKKMKRGGLVGPLWRDRFASRKRLLDNIRIPLEARRRGVSTPEPLAMLVVPGPAPLYRAWIAVRSIPEARDLASRYIEGDPPSENELSAVLDLVRGMHDAGVEHRDLNLGNLMVRPGAGALPEPFVIDLDRARLHDGGVPLRLRLRALRRLERSYVKICGGVAESFVAVRGSRI